MKQVQEAVLNIGENRSLDYPLLVLALIIMSIGLVMIASSSMYYADSMMSDEYHYLKRHGIYIVLAIVLGICALLIPLQYLYKLTPWIFLVSLILLSLVLLPSIGRMVNGSRRWIDFGVLTFQVAEAVKIALILFVSSYVTRRGDELRRDWKGFIKPLILMLIVAILLLLQPDFGSVAVLVAITIGMLFIAGVPMSRLLLIGSVGVGLMALAIIESPYRLQRLLGFMNPWEGDNEFGSSYQLAQSLIAYGNGQWIGLGLGNSLQKLFYLPEAHTDFIMAIIAEETGFFGVVVVILLIALLIAKCLVKGKRLLAGQGIYQHSKRSEVKKEYALYCGYICFGTAFYFASHATVNIAMSMGLMPTKGLTLPFVSYGGSSLLMATTLLAIVIKIDKEFIFDSERVTG